MEPRPILLVEEGVFGLERVCERAGYLVIRAPKDRMDCMRVVAPCPFTAADVELLRRAITPLAPPTDGMYNIVIESNETIQARAAGLASIADRIDAMLP